jgi:hypothetical protein
VPPAIPAMLLAIAAGAAVGTGIRFIYQWRRLRPALDPFTAGHVFGLPLTSGFVTGAVAGWCGADSWLLAAMLPLATLAVICTVTLALRWQRLLSIILNLPAFAIMGMLGGLMSAHAVRTNPGTVVLVGAILSALPVAASLIESRHPARRRTRWVRTSTVVSSEAGAIWERIVRVAPIESKEWGAYRLFALLGFPAPQRAELNLDGLGGLRLGIFSNRVLFEEPVAVWEPGRRVAFDVHVNAEAIGELPFDEFTRIGGAYLDLHRAQYVLEPLGSGRVRLHLMSLHSVTTRLNGYAGWWAEVILAAFQRNILALIRARCEAIKTASDSQVPCAAGR